MAPLHGGEPIVGSDGTGAADAQGSSPSVGRSVSRRCYCPRPMARTPGSRNSRKFKRSQPSEAEQLRRTRLIREMAARVQASTDQWKRDQGVI